MTISTEQLLNEVAAMTVNQLVELTKAIEDKFGVKASDVQPKMVIVDETGPEEEQTEFDVVIKDVGIRKIEVIKTVRKITGLGLKESKNVTEEGSVILVSVDKDEGEKAKASLEAAGATVELK